MKAKLRDLLEPLQYPAFRRVWVSGLLSQLGDWAARLALSVMVFHQTESALAAAAALAVSILPWLGPGQWLTAATERYPRRRVMVTADLGRALLFALAAIGLPLPALFVVLFVSGLATPPFEAARLSVLPELLPKPVFASSQALRGITDDATLIGGYLVGGAVLAVLSPGAALLANALGFTVSAVLLFGLPSSAAPSREPGGSASRLAEAARLLAGTPYLRRAAASVTIALAAADTLILLAVPRVVGELHRGPIVVSWLIALACLVTIGVTLLIPHRVDGGRLLGIGAVLLAVGGLGTAAALVVDRGLGGLAVAFALSGLLAVVMVPANIVVCSALPAQTRASALSILLGSLYAAQAVIPVVAGAAADAVGVTTTCAVVMLLAGLYGAFALARPVVVPAHWTEPGPAPDAEPADPVTQTPNPRTPHGVVPSQPAAPLSTPSATESATQSAGSVHPTVEVPA